MNRFLLLVAALLTCVAAATDSGSRTTTAEADRSVLLLGESYPIEARVSFHASLFHWLDSLGGLNGPGMTAGKTERAHRMDFAERLGQPTPRDREMLQRFVELRRWFGANHRAGDRDALTTAFFETSTTTQALDRARALLGRKRGDELGAVVEYFSSRYRKVWDDGRIPRRFLERAAEDPQRQALTGFLVQVARFYGVSADQRPRPRVILVPVRDGHGTHAQAIGHNLLIEIRPWEGLSDEVSPIVHENAHFLFQKISASRRRALGKHAVSRGRAGQEAWHLLREALPTAIGQGVAGERFLGESWNSYPRWYHIEAVDRYAKSIFPGVKSALAQGRVLDKAFLHEMIEIYRRDIGGP